MGRRKFSKQFKRDAVALMHTSQSSGKSMSSVANELGVRPNVLRAWENMVAGERKTGLVTDELEELTRLRKDNERLRMEVEILKKATAFFARESK